MTKTIIHSVLCLALISAVSSLTSLHNVNRGSQSNLHQTQQQQPSSTLNLRHQHKHSQSPSHKYWFNKNHPTDFFLSSARQWNYCDYKCLYLENYNKNKDFVVIVMGAPLKQDFSACYVKNGEDYTLWNQIMNNKFYEENCGQDDKDWMKSGKFDVKGIYGVGIGTNLNQTQIYK